MVQAIEVVVVVTLYGCVMCAGGVLMGLQFGGWSSSHVKSWIEAWLLMRAARIALRRERMR